MKKNKFKYNDHSEEKYLGRWELKPIKEIRIELKELSLYKKCKYVAKKARAKLKSYQKEGIYQNNEIADFV